MTGTAALWLLLASALALPAAASESSTAPPESEVQLLRYPHPYRAAVTISSDTHRVAPGSETMSAQRFEAIHTLLNTRRFIERGSLQWEELFRDAAIDERPEWEQGIEGFGLPVGDSVSLYYPTSGVFRRFDHDAGEPVPQSYEGRDYRRIVDEWMRKGWIDSLHTAGPGHVTRDAVREGLDWLTAEPHRRIEVYLNHSMFNTPSAVEIDRMSTFFSVRRAYQSMALATMRALGIGDAVAAAVRPVAGEAFAKTLRLKLRQDFGVDFPPGERLKGWGFTAAMAVSGVWLLACVAIPRLRSRGRLLAGGVALLGSLGLSLVVPIYYAQGDNPRSSFYNLDLLQEAGFRYFWMTLDSPGYPSVVHTLALPERDWGERRSYLRTLTMDDGSRVLAFPRSQLGRGGRRSFDLLTPAGLDELVESKGTAILMCHLLTGAHLHFDASGLDGLRNLQRYHRDGRVWVAPSVEILRFERARTFLEYSTHREGGTQVIDIEGIDDPVQGFTLPDPEALSGISFRIADAEEVELRLAGEPLPGDRYERIEGPGHVVARLR